MAVVGQNKTLRCGAHTHFIRFLSHGSENDVYNSKNEMPYEIRLKLSQHKHQRSHPVPFFSHSRTLTHSMKSHFSFVQFVYIYLRYYLFFFHLVAHRTIFFLSSRLFCAHWICIHSDAVSQWCAAIFDEYDLLSNKMRWHFIHTHIFKSQRCKPKLVMNATLTHARAAIFTI